MICKNDTHLNTRIKHALTNVTLNTLSTNPQHTLKTRHNRRHTHIHKYTPTQTQAQTQIQAQTQTQKLTQKRTHTQKSNNFISVE